MSQLNESLTGATLGQQALFWGVRVTAFAGCLFGAQWVVYRGLAGRLNVPIWLKPVVIVSAIALLPFAAVELFLEMRLPTTLAYDDTVLWSRSPLLAFGSEYATLASVVIPLHFLIWLLIEKRVRKSTPEAETTEALSPEFLQKVPGLGLRDIVAIKAEEHYIRIFANDGNELIHYKFGDALKHLPEESGLQVHRSWWIADAYVASSRRGERRWQLIMAGNIEVPVSDRYVKDVRNRGHFRRKRRATAGSE